jgi:hypothetical protein
MRTKILTVDNIKTLLLEILLNKTDKVTKVSSNSVLNAIFYSLSKLFQKGMKDSSIVESMQFPEYAYGQDLDLISKRQGSGTRFGTLGSSTFVRVVGEPGTSYSFEQNIFSSSSGLQFKASENWTLPSCGVLYVRVGSILQGSSTVIPPYTINRLLAPPTGHKYCINEVMTLGGRDIESDDIFRGRVQKGFDMLSTDTLSKLTQILISLNPSVLKVKKLGRGTSGLVNLGIVTQTGMSLTDEELSYLLDNSKNFLSLSDLRPLKNNYTGVIFSNIEYFPISVDFRVDLYPGSDLKEFSTQIQIKIFNYLDWRYWEEGQKVEWDNLFILVKNNPMVKYLPDQYFKPRADISTDSDSLPRLVSFIVRGVSGEVLIDSSSFIQPVFYQNYLNLNFSTTVLANL